MGVKRKVFTLKFIVMLVLALLLITGCQPEEGGGTEPTATPVPLPVCAAADMVAPVLSTPGAGAVVNTSLPILEWTFSAPCDPESYRIDLSVTPDFSDTSLSGGTGNPSTSWMPGDDLADCTTYYWQVAAFSDGELGPFSESWAFSTDFGGTCASLPFSVTAVSAEVAPTESTVPCGDTERFTFTGTITTDGPGIVTYQWERSDGVSSPVEILDAPAAGDHTVSATWDLSAAGTHWELLHVLMPNDISSGQAEFTLNCTGGTCAGEDLVAPVLSTPADGSTVSELWPRLYWSYPGECNPEGYRVDLATDPSFADTSLSGSTGNPSTDWAPGDYLAPATTYYWRVAGGSGTELGPYSDTWSFTTPSATTGGEPAPGDTGGSDEKGDGEPGEPDPAACLIAPEQTAPANGSTTSELWPSLQWRYLPTDCVPDRYIIHLDTDPGFTSTALNGGTSGPSTSWAPGHELDPDTVYYWRVGSVREDYLGEWSATWSFRTPPAEPGVCDMNAPTLDSPADGAVVREDWPTLNWSYSGDCAPEGYRIDLATDPSFADTSLSGGTGNPSTRWAPGDPLDDCETYYWRVAGIIGYTLGPWSETWEFSVNASRKCTY